jgi:hypothetical protein
MNPTSGGNAMKLFWITLCCLLLVAVAALAQSGQGRITGTISDPAGAVIPGATVEAKNSQTGALYETASTSTGNYTISSLPPGVYQLSASVPGFKQFLQTGITVLAAQTLRIDIALEVGEITETVTVDADAPLLRTETGELSHNVNTTRLDDLPIMGFGSIRSSYNVTQSATTCTAGGMMKGPRGALRLMKRAKALQMAIALAFFPPPLGSECTLESPVHLIQLC